MNLDTTYATAQEYANHGQHAIARTLWLTHAKLKREHLSAHHGLMLSYIATHEYHAAEAHASMCCFLAPTTPDFYWLYGQLLQVNQKPEAEVLRAFLKLEHLAPNWQGMHLPMAKIYFGARQTDLAATYFEHALKSVEGDANATTDVQWEYAMMLLTLGEYQRGWLYHEARLARFGQPGLNLAPLPAPVWQGEPLHGKTIVVHGEQGIGDEIMYASMLNDLMEQSAHIVFACYPPLVPMMQKSFPRIQVVAHQRGSQDMLNWQSGIMPKWWYNLTQSTKVDYQIPMGSLAYHLRPHANSFPRKPYVLVDEALQAKQRLLLEQQARAQSISLEGKQLIGLAWCGNLDNPHGRAKSIELNQLTPLASTVSNQNIVFVSLQNRQYGKQALVQNALPIIDMSDFTDDFADTLALASLCQHIITIDTSYFHVCAAAGLPITLLLRRNCDWRFGWTSDDCVWYKNVNVIRQSKDLDWHNVINQLENNLRQNLTA